jgi:flagellar FliL protein
MFWRYFARALITTSPPVVSRKIRDFGISQKFSRRRTHEAQKGLHMSETRPQSGETLDAAPPRKRRGKKLLFLGIFILLLAGGGFAAWQFVPGLADKTRTAAGRAEPAEPLAAATKPVFIDLPEMALTLPNNGHPRQMRIKLSIELAKGTTEKGAAEALSPRVYDALLTYLRTLRDGEIDGGLGLDRLRADLFRRMDLVMGPGVLRDVLITSLVLA